MKLLEDLKKDVFEKLSDHKKIEAFFKDSLEERMKIDDGWIENPLVLILLDEESFEHSAIHTLINVISDDEENFNILKRKLKPKDEYVKKIRDALAELNAYYHLRKYLFENIHALQEDNTQKMPDFAAVLRDERFVFEVKNMRAPIEVCDLLCIKTEARGYSFPEIYKRTLISYSLSAKWRQIEFNRLETDDIKRKVEEWLKKMFIRIESAKTASLISVPPLHLTNEDLEIRCNLRKGENLAPVCGFIGYVNVNDLIYKQSILLPFAKKVHQVSCNASGQLLEYDKADQHKKYVLLNWQRSSKSRVPIWDGFENDVHEIVKGIDLEVKNRSDDLFVKFLNFDSLP